MVNLQKSELEPKQGFEFVGYKYDLSHGLVKPTQSRWDSILQKVNTIQTNLSSQKFYVLDRPAHSDRKTGSSGQTSYETGSVAPKETLEGPRISREGDSNPKVPSPAPPVVDQRNKWPNHSEEWSLHQEVFKPRLQTWHLP